VPRNSRHPKLLANEDVSRWHRNIARRNKTRADDWLRKLGLFCERMDTTPADLLKMDGESIADLLEDYADKFALTSTAKVLSVVKSLCVRKGIIVDWKINTTAIPGLRWRPNKGSAPAANSVAHGLGFRRLLLLSAWCQSSCD
jgi:hypothetical protein